MIRIIEITDAAGAIVEPLWLARAEAVHRQLRTDLVADYDAALKNVFAGGGRMVVLAEDDAVRAVAIWRVHENTFNGLQLYVDDLVTDEAARSKGHGGRLLDWLEARARALNCRVLALDSGVQRGRAHAFYFRKGFVIPSFNFRKRLS